MTIAVATPVVFVIRVYINENDRESAGNKMNIPYTYSCTAILTEDLVTIEGLAPLFLSTVSQKSAVSQKNAIFDELRRIGAKKVRWIRFKDGKEKELEFDL